MTTPFGLVLMARILGIDVGERRIGVAVSDPDGRLAVPLRIIERRDDESALDELTALAREEGASELVVGHPLSLDGTAGPQARLVEAFAEELAQAAELPVKLWDERLTSVRAERPRPTRRQRARGPRQRKVPKDDLAAAVLLQAFLDRRRSESRQAGNS